jgi:hypothetical protein
VIRERIIQLLRDLPSPIAETQFQPGYWRSCASWPQITEQVADSLDSGLGLEHFKPIRELHQPILRTDYTDERWVECTSCCGEWPCDTAKLIYTAEELDQ